MNNIKAIKIIILLISSICLTTEILVNEITAFAASNSKIVAIETEPDSGTEETETNLETKLTPVEFVRQQQFIAADRLYLSGKIEAATNIYRSLKSPFSQENELETKLPDPIYDAEKLPPAAAVYWRIASQGIAQNLGSKIFIPLELLVTEYPQFIPAHLAYAQALKDYEKSKEALQILEKAVTKYSNEPELLKALIQTYGEQKQWLEASLVARQFALINPEHPQASEFMVLAETNLERYQRHLRSELRGNAIANIITGALGYTLTGSLFGPLSALETTALLLQGESAVGERITNQVKEQVPMVEDPEVLAYVNEIGQKLAKVAGRNQFDYQFYIIMDDEINAFALPGGKVFVNAGAILETKSEAELAGLLAHELSHAVLSHGFQLVTQGNLTANLAQFIPFGGTAANLIVLDYSRDMERQADILGTKILAASGYAADGLRNLTLTLEEQDKPNPPVWLSSHPDTGDRVKYLESLIVNNNYNRYAYEGVIKHSQIQTKVRQLINEYKQSEDYQERDQ